MQSRVVEDPRVIPRQLWVPTKISASKLAAYGLPALAAHASIENGTQSGGANDQFGTGGAGLSAGGANGMGYGGGGGGGGANGMGYGSMGMGMGMGMGGGDGSYGGHPGPAHTFAGMGAGAMLSGCGPSGFGGGLEGQGLGGGHEGGGGGGGGGAVAQFKEGTENIKAVAQFKDRMSTFSNNSRTTFSNFFTRQFDKKVSLDQAVRTFRQATGLPPPGLKKLQKRKLEKDQQDMIFGKKDPHDLSAIGGPAGAGGPGDPMASMGSMNHQLSQLIAGAQHAPGAQGNPDNTGGAASSLNPLHAALGGGIGMNKKMNLNPFEEFMAGREHLCAAYPMVSLNLGKPYEGKRFFTGIITI